MNFPQFLPLLLFLKLILLSLFFLLEESYWVFFLQVISYRFLFLLLIVTLLDLIFWGLGHFLQIIFKIDFRVKITDFEDMLFWHFWSFYFFGYTFYKIFLFFHLFFLWEEQVRHFRNLWYFREFFWVCQVIIVHEFRPSHSFFRVLNQRSINQEVIIPKLFLDFYSTHQ